MENTENTGRNPLFSANLSTAYPQRPAIVGGGQSISYEQLHRGIALLTLRLREMGVRKGSRVALWGYNSANWLAAFFAIVRAGGTAVLLNYSMSCNDAAELLTMTGTAFLVSGDNGETKKDPDAMRRLAELAGIPAERCLDIRKSVLDMEELASEIGFGKRRAMSIRLAVEEMLSERITDAYSAAGDIRLKITLMPEWLRVAFSDDGAEYFIDKRRDTSMSAMIILMAVSDFHTDYPDGKPVYCMDFVYENEFSIQEFLLKSRQEAEKTA